VSEIDLSKFICEALADVPQRGTQSSRTLEGQFSYCRSRDSGLPTPCRIYRGSKSSDGYAQFFFEGKMLVAHRALWERLIGPVPSGKVVVRRCGHKDCLELSHLYLADESEKWKRKGAQR
jgi:HNH endonuclease